MSKRSLQKKIEKIRSSMGAFTPALGYMNQAQAMLYEDSARKRSAHAMYMDGQWPEDVVKKLQKGLRDPSKVSKTKPRRYDYITLPKEEKLEKLPIFSHKYSREVSMPNYAVDPMTAKYNSSWYSAKVQLNALEKSLTNDKFIVKLYPDDAHHGHHIHIRIYVENKYTGHCLEYAVENRSWAASDRLPHELEGKIRTAVKAGMKQLIDEEDSKLSKSEHIIRKLEKQFSNKVFEVKIFFSSDDYNHNHGYVDVTDHRVSPALPQREVVDNYGIQYHDGDVIANVERAIHRAKDQLEKVYAIRAPARKPKIKVDYHVNRATDLSDIHAKPGDIAIVHTTGEHYMRGNPGGWFPHSGKVTKTTAPGNIDGGSHGKGTFETCGLLIPKWIEPRPGTQVYSPSLKDYKPTWTDQYANPPKSGMQASREMSDLSDAVSNQSVKLEDKCDYPTMGDMLKQMLMQTDEPSYLSKWYNDFGSIDYDSVIARSLEVSKLSGKNGDLIIIDDPWQEPKKPYLDRLRSKMRSWSHGSVSKVLHHRSNLKGYADAVRDSNPLRREHS